MRIRKMNYADAFLVGPEVNVQEFFDSIWSDHQDDERYKFNVRFTKGSNRLIIPTFSYGNGEINPRLQVKHLTFKWPIIPLIKHRGGYMTATARSYVELGWPYEDIDGNYIEREGKYTRTRHRVVYANRTRGCLVVDVLLRP